MHSVAVNATGLSRDIFTPHFYVVWNKVAQASIFRGSYASGSSIDVELFEIRFCFKRKFKLCL
jgi:hypothetical protein